MGLWDHTTRVSWSDNAVAKYGNCKYGGASQKGGNSVKKVINAEA